MSAVRRAAPDPLRLFRKWYAEACRAGIALPEAMALATATPAGMPSVRIVLYRGLSKSGLVFFTSYQSRKAAEIFDNPRGALVFHWQPLERQIRLEGAIRKLEQKESDRYFRTRPRESRLSAWASPQSAVVPDRAYLEERFEAARLRYEGKDVPRPRFWGGFRLVPHYVEFWQGQPHRLHDRRCYLKERGRWRLAVLGP